MPHCSSLCICYPTDLCFLRIPLCPPHLAAHIPMSRHFFAMLKAASDFARAKTAIVFMRVKINPTRSSSIKPPIPDFHSFDNMCSLRYKFEINLRLNFFRIRKGEKNESQKLDVSRPGSYYLRWLFSPLMRQKTGGVRTGDVRG